MDQLAQDPRLVPEAIYTVPPPSGHPVVDALLAAAAEKLADEANLPRPTWAAGAPELDELYLPPLARNVDGRSVPHQLRARGLMIDTESLWRASEIADV